MNGDDVELLCLFVDRVKVVIVLFEKIYIEIEGDFFKLYMNGFFSWFLMDFDMIYIFFGVVVEICFI